MMKTYNLVGFATLLFQVLLSAILAPPWLGPWWGIVIGFGYLLLSWFLGGLYLSDMMHLGIAHRALDYKPWFMRTVTLINNTVGVYVDPVSWVNRHRHLAGCAGVRAMGEHGAELLDPRSTIRYARYDDAGDNAMNVGDWLPVMATFSACWQNNQHHYPHLLRTTHDPAEFDFGYATVRVMRAARIRPSSTGPMGNGNLHLLYPLPPLIKRPAARPKQAARWHTEITLESTANG